MKRANGTGSIVKLSGNRRRPWAVRIPPTTPSGAGSGSGISPTTPKPATPRPRWTSGAAPTPPRPPRSSTTPSNRSMTSGAAGNIPGWAPPPSPPTGRHGAESQPWPIKRSGASPSTTCSRSSTRTRPTGSPSPASRMTRP